MPQVHYERLHVKEPRTERLRKGAAGRLRHLLSKGWHETERTHSAEYVTVRFEREGKPPERVPPPPRAAGPNRGPRRGGGPGRPPRR
jgi:hypothetical protein